MAADGTVKILIQADGKEAISSVDDLVARLDGIGKAGQRTGSILKSVLGANLISHAVIAGVSTIKNGIVGLAGDLSSASATWKTFNANMKNIGMPDAEIKATTKELQKFAQQTIYSSADMASTFSQLRAVGTKNTTQLIEGFGGLASAADDPAQAMKTLSQQATQMAAKPKVQWEDFKLMLEQTPAGMAAVAKAMGKSTSQLITDIQAGKVSTSDFFDAVNKAGNAPGFRQMATQYKTVGQAVDGLRETLTNKLLGAFNKVNTVAINAISKMVDLVGNMDFSGVANATVAALNGIANAITFVVQHADELTAAAVAVATFLAVFKAIQVVTNFKKAVADAGTVLKAFQAALGVGPWGILAAAIAAVVVGLTYFFTKTQTGQKLWAQFVGWLKQAGPVFSAVGNSIKELVAAGLAKLAPILTAVGSAVGKLAPFFSQAASAVGSFVSAGIDKLGTWFGAIAESAGSLLQSGLSKIGPLMDSMGGAFGKVGALIGPVVSVITKLGLAALGITGPWGVAISVIASFLGMWAKTGELNADGITAVFSSITSTITNVANGISKYLPQFIAIGTQLLVSLINGITAAIPQMVTAATSIINGLTSAIAVALPAIITAGTQILLMLVQAITAALPSLVAAGVQIINGLVNAIVAVLPVLISAGLQLILALVQGIVAVLPMLITAALQIVMALFNGLVAALPTIISAGLQILLALVNGIVAALPTIITAAIQIILALFNALVAALPQIIAAGIQILLALINGIISILPALVSAAVQIIISLFSALIANLPKIISAGIELLLALVQGLIKMIPALLSGAVQIITALFGALIQNAPKILSAGVQLIKALISGLLQLLGQVGSAAMKLGAKVIGAIKDKASDMASAGVDFVKGFIGGIGSMVSNVVKAAENLGRKAVDGVKKFLHIGSPSRVMRQIGVWTGEGFTNGIKEMLPRVSAMSDKMADAAMISTPSVDLGGVSGSIPRFTSAEQLIGGFNQSVPSMQTINNYTSTTNNSGSSDKVLDLLQQIADKSPIIDGASVSGGLAPFMSAQTAARTKTARRGGAVIARIQ